MVVDDYGHHPDRDQGHVERRQERLGAADRRSLSAPSLHPHPGPFDDFLSAFNQADVLFLTEIYPAGEDPIPDVNARHLYEGIKAYGHRDVTFIPEKKQIPDHVLSALRRGDIVLTLGAGDIWKVGEEIGEKLKNMATEDTEKNLR